MSLALAPIDVSVDIEANLPCRKFDPDLWFSDSPAQLELAKSLCGDCPLRVECLAGAVERNEPWGVWGGEIFERGAVVARKRPRGRPRKADVARDAEMAAEERLIGHLSQRLDRPGLAIRHLRKSGRGTAHAAPRGRHLTGLAYRLPCRADRGADTRHRRFATPRD